MKAIALIAAPLFFLTSSLSHAAEAPKSTEKLEIQATHYNVGGRAIEGLRNGDTVLYIGENCATGGYAESDAQAFAALYERLVGQARFLFKSKADEAK